MSIPTEHQFDFDPTCGLTLAQLRAVAAPEAPPGLDAFWRARYLEALATRPRPEIGRADDSRHPAWHVHDISYLSTGETRIGGWLLLPRVGHVRRGLVVGHGYGGRDGPDFDMPVTDTAVLFPCFRGLGQSRQPPISTDPALHVLHDIDDPARYVLGGCVDDLWLAVSALLELCPGTAGHVGYSGGSLGGGIGALALAHDNRIARGHLVVPTFGNMPLWLAMPSVGSAHAVQLYAARHPEVRETLALFDAATAASRIAKPMLVAVARFDPAVAPPCQFSVANAMPAAQHNEIVVLNAGHFAYEGMQAEQDRLAEKVEHFFNAT